MWSQRSQELGGLDPYGLVFDSLPFPTVVLDRRMMVDAANRSFLERYGLEEDQVVGHPCYEVFYGRATPCPAERCQFPQALSGQENCVNMHQYVDESGEEVYEEISLVPLRDAGGRVAGILEIVRDLTEAKRLEGSLKQTNEFLNRLLDSMVGVVVAADLEGKILFVNKSVRRVLGYTQEELVGKPLKTLSPPDDLRYARRLLHEGGGQVQGVRTRVFAKDGEEVPVRLNSSYVYRDGAPVATVGIFADLRERLKMEDHLVQARMQVVHSEKMARLGRMAAGIAHELNNPLTGITVYVELLKESLEGGHPAQEDLSCIMEDAERCREIVQGLLEYSRQSEIRVEEADLSEVVEDAFNLIRDNSVFMHVEVVRDYAGRPLIFQGDAKLLRQVFINLLMNAVDAMAGRGRLTVRTYEDAEGWRVAEVSDTGPGIAAEHARRVFDPFFTTKEVGKGTGLGLSVAYGVITRHGGEIKLKETGPGGTTFQVRLPSTAPGDLVAFARAYNPREQGEEEIS
jgi:PAS domain S-box-containing protein